MSVPWLDPLSFLVDQSALIVASLGAAWLATVASVWISPTVALAAAWAGAGAAWALLRGRPEHTGGAAAAHAVLATAVLQLVELVRGGGHVELLGLLMTAWAAALMTWWGAWVVLRLRRTWVRS